MNQAPHTERLLGLLTGAAAGVLTLGLVVMGSSELGVAAWLGTAVVAGPAWLGPALGIAAVGLAALLGGTLAPLAHRHPVRAATVAVAVVLAADVAWVLVWTAIRLIASGDTSAWFLPVEEAFISAAGLLIACVAIVPVALVWAAIMRTILARVAGQPDQGTRVAT